MAEPILIRPMFESASDEDEVRPFREFNDAEHVNIGQVKEWMSRLQYNNPGVGVEMSFKVESSYAVLIIDRLVPDTHDPSKTIRVAHMTELSPYACANFETFTAWWRQAIHRASQHEDDEWMLVDGDRKFDPHRRG